MIGQISLKLTARTVWMRQQLSKLWNLFSTALSRSIVRVKWSVKPVSTDILHGPDSGSLTPFAYSSAVIGLEKLQSFRVINRSGDAVFINSTTWVLNNSEELTGGIIAGAEDARVFQYDGKLYIYFQVSFRNLDGSQDCRVYVFDPRTSTTWLVSSPFQFSGKNWIPYEDSGDLHFIYSLQPLIVIKVVSWSDEQLSTQVVHDESNFISQKISWGDEKGSFGAIRGGSQLLRISGDIFVGFTHITPPGVLKFSHQAGVIFFNARDKTFKHKALTKVKPGLLVDPFGIEIDEEKVRMIYSYSVNNPHETYSVVGSTIATFNFSDLILD